MRNVRAAWLLAAAAMLAGAPATAQTARPVLDYASAAAIRDGCIAWAGERDLKLAVAIYDEAGRLISFAHMDGAATAVAEFAMWKGRSAATIRFPSSETANWGRGPASLATWQGGLPFFSADGVPLGGIGVSGAEGAEDAACAAAGIAAAGFRTTAE